MIVIADKFGQLGNRLFQFSHFIAFAASSGVTVANPAFEEYAGYFPAFDDDLLTRYPLTNSVVRPTDARRSVVFRAASRLTGLLPDTHGDGRGPVRLLELEPDEECSLADDAFTGRARRRGVLLVRGWLFRDEEGFRTHAELIRSVFTPLDAHLRSVDEVEAHAREGADLLVGVHIRHGEYADWAGGRHYHSLDVYAAIMRRVEALFPDREIGFLVCSDDPANRTDLGDARVTWGPGHQLEDMYALARCDYLVGPPSTYTGWASFYGRVPLYRIEDPEAAISLESFGDPPG